MSDLEILVWCCFCFWWSGFIVKGCRDSHVTEIRHAGGLPDIGDEHPTEKGMFVFQFDTAAETVDRTCVIVRYRNKKNDSWQLMDGKRVSK